MMQLRVGILVVGGWGNVLPRDAAVRPGREQSLLRVMAFQHLLLSFADSENGTCQCACS